VEGGTSVDAESKRKRKSKNDAEEQERGLHSPKVESKHGSVNFDKSPAKGVDP